MPIRPVREADFAVIAAITNHYIATTAIHFAYEPIAAAELAAHWRGARDRYPWLAITDDDGDDAGVGADARVLGYAKAGPWRDREAYRFTPELGLYLDPTVRGRGLGRTLLAALLVELTARGFHSVIAGIALPNDASVALHVRAGFVAVGTVREAGRKLERWHDVAFFQKSLTS